MEDSEIDTDYRVNNYSPQNSSRDLLQIPETERVDSISKVQIKHKLAPPVSSTPTDKETANITSLNNASSQSLPKIFQNRAISVTDNFLSTQLLGANPSSTQTLAAMGRSIFRNDRSHQQSPQPVRSELQIGTISEKLGLPMLKFQRGGSLTRRAASILATTHHDPQNLMKLSAKDSKLEKKKNLLQNYFIDELQSGSLKSLSIDHERSGQI